MIGYLAKTIYKAKVVDFVEVNEYRKLSLEKLNICDHIFSQKDLKEKMDNMKGSYHYVFTACSVFETHLLGIKLLANGGSINFFGGLPTPSPLSN